ncbi:SRPBCC family protein [Methylocaldum sp.]|uniref:SRPBCC family protein n=1 Tax=Methylocaldum sp. TaxID=1969727 RepID=UPI002D42774E|nr:SRPBCC family protein [Methylocaldum sp.]HYE34254.1 SRPBCC family protein [Methylocaldum sp.]
MASLHKSIEIDVLVQVAYNQWTQYEEFPAFMENVREVRRVDDTHLHWRGMIAGKPLEWDTEIVEQVPEKRIAWRNPAAPDNHGVIMFESLNKGRARVTLDVEYQPESVEEKIGDLLGIMEANLEDDLQHFKEFVEARGRYTGGPDPDSVSPA